MGDWPEGLLREEADAVILAVAVQPAAKRVGIEGIDVWRGRLQVAVQALPQKGAANEAVCELLSEAFGIPLVFIEIIAGQFLEAFGHDTALGDHKLIVHEN